MSRKTEKPVVSVNIFLAVIPALFFLIVLAGDFRSCFAAVILVACIVI